MRKRILYYPLLILALCLVLFGCATDPAIEETSAPTEPAATTQPTEPPMTEPANPVVDDGDTTEYELFSEDVYMGLVNARNDVIPLGEDWGYGDSYEQSSNITIITKCIHSLGIYTADGAPIYACGYTLYYEQADGTRKAVGTVYAGEEGSNLYVLHNGDYRIARIAAENTASWIRAYYSHWDQFGAVDRGMEFDHLRYNHKITIDAWKTGLSNVDGIRINNGREATEKTYAKEQTVDWGGLSWEKFTSDASEGLSNSPYAYYLDSRVSGTFNVNIVITANKIQSLGLYTSEGYAIYAVRTRLYYDDNDGTPHLVGALYGPSTYWLASGTYYIGRIDGYAEDSSIGINLGPLGSRVEHMEFSSPAYNQKITIKRTDDGESSASIEDADPAEFKMYSNEVYVGLLNAKLPVPGYAISYLSLGIDISTEQIRSFGLYTSEGYPVYGKNGLLYFDDAEGSAHWVGWATPKDSEDYQHFDNYQYSDAYHYHLNNGEYRIGKIDVAGEDAVLQIHYLSDGFVSTPGIVHFTELDNHTKITIHRWEPGKTSLEGIVRNDEDSFIPESCTDEVFVGLRNAIKEHGQYLNANTLKELPTPECEQHLGSISIDAYGIQSFALYSADGFPIFAYNGSLLYADAEQVLHHVGNYKRYLNQVIKEEFIHYSLTMGEYRIAWIENDGKNPRLYIGYKLIPDSVQIANTKEFANLDNSDKILIQQWQPDRTNEDGILIQRG